MIVSSIHDYDLLEQHDKKNIDWFVVNWCLGNTCNYACSYCPTSLHDGSRKWHSLENVKAFVGRIKAIHPTKKIYFEFTGGEVTLNKDFIAICQFCHENDVKVGFISNGSRTIRWWEENKQHFDHVMLSFHVEYADPDHFVKVVELLRFQVLTHVNVMMHPERFDECLMVASRVKALGNASIAVQPLIHDLANEMYDYPPDQRYILDHQREIFGNIKWYKKFNNFYRGSVQGTRSDGSLTPIINPHDFINLKTNNWFGWDCWAGAEQLIVDKDGSIYRGWCKVGGLIGHIGDLDLALPTEPVHCNKHLCHCNFDIMCTKKRKEGSV